MKDALSTQAVLCMGLALAVFGCTPESLDLVPAQKEADAARLGEHLRNQAVLEARLSSLLFDVSDLEWPQSQDIEAISRRVETLVSPASCLTVDSNALLFENCDSDFTPGPLNGEIAYAIDGERVVLNGDLASPMPEDDRIERRRRKTFSMSMQSSDKGVTVESTAVLLDESDSPVHQTRQQYVLTKEHEDCVRVEDLIGEIDNQALRADAFDVCRDLCPLGEGKVVLTTEAGDIEVTSRGRNRGFEGTGDWFGTLSNFRSDWLYESRSDACVPEHPFIASALTELVDRVVRSPEPAGTDVDFTDATLSFQPIEGFLEVSGIMTAGLPQQYPITVTASVQQDTPECVVINATGTIEYFSQTWNFSLEGFERCGQDCPADTATMGIKRPLEGLVLDPEFEFKTDSIEIWDPRFEPISRSPLAFQTVCE